MAKTNEEKYSELIRYALNLVARKRYGKNEITKKLNKISKNKQLKNKVIKRLEELGYIDDEKYIIDYTDSVLKRSPQGLYLIKQKLILKGFNSELIDTTFPTLNIDELEFAKTLISKKKILIGKVPENKRKQKIFSVLASKGFKTDTIYKVLDEC